MKTLLVCLAILNLAIASCPSGFDLVKDGECRGFHSRDQANFASATQQAVKRCASIEGKPVIIHDEEQQSYWMNRAPPPTEAFLILGLVCNSNTKKWEWSDGSSLDYKPAPTHYPLELDGPCSDGVSWDLHPDGYWSFGNSGQMNAMYFCTTQLTQPIPGGDGCDGFDDDAEDGVCYQVGAAPETWQDAYMTCKEFGAEIASVHNKQENSFLRRLAVSRGAANGMYLGATTQKDGSFVWMDGTTMDYENYYPGFPKKNFGDCLAMDTSETAGQWMNVDCSTKYPIACVRPQKVDNAPECTGQDYKEGDIITTPGYPFSASTLCDYFLTVPAGKHVQLQIINLQANKCCDSLIIYDGYLGGSVIATLSGEEQNVIYTTSTSNIMRVSWQPDGGVNVRGLAFTYRAI